MQYCTSYAKGNSDPEVVSVSLPGLAQLTLQLPSELVVARGNWTLRSRAFVSGSSCSLFGCTLHGAMLGSTVGTCYASAPGVSGRFSL